MSADTNPRTYNRSDEERLADIAFDSQARIRELEQRIAKAKEILEGFRVSMLGTIADRVINDALDALEGK